MVVLDTTIFFWLDVDMCEQFLVCLSVLSTHTIVENMVKKVQLVYRRHASQRRIFIVGLPSIIPLWDMTVWNSGNGKVWLVYYGQSSLLFAKFSGHSDPQKPWVWQILIFKQPIVSDRRNSRNTTFP